MKALVIAVTLTAFLLALGSPAAFTAPVAVDPPKTDADALQGVWQRVSPGPGSRSNALTDMLLVIDGTRLAIQHHSDRVEEAEFIIDPAAAPKGIRVEFDDGAALGLYELDGDTLRLSLAAPGRPRPRFLGSVVSGVMVAEFRRADDGAKGK